MCLLLSYVCHVFVVICVSCVCCCHMCVMCSHPHSISVDAFIGLLFALDNTQEVQDYIRSYLGETREALSFAKQFLEKRQKLKASSQPQPPQAQSSSSVSFKIS